MTTNFLKAMTMGLLLAACSSPITEEEALSQKPNEWSWPGTYTYLSIDKNGSPIGTCTDQDSLLLTDTAFLYDIEGIDKHAAGTYTREQNQEGQTVLVFNYRWANKAISIDSPLIRRFTVDYACCDSMHMWETSPEGDTLSFSYRKQAKTSPCCH
jgi:hypothetical protein